MKMPKIYSPLSSIGEHWLAVKTTPLLNNSDRNTTRNFMNLSLLELLRCPYCGNRLSLADNISLKQLETTIDSGVLGCECCAFPVVSGIPTLIANDTTRETVRALEAESLPHMSGAGSLYSARIVSRLILQEQSLDRISPLWSSPWMP